MPYQRKFTLLDGMIFIAATAVALGWERVYLTYVSTQFVFSSMPRPFVIRLYFAGIAPFLVMYALTLLGRGLRAPRPPIRRLARRPGMAACLAIALGVAVAGLCVPVQLAVSAFDYSTYFSRGDLFGGTVFLFTQRVWISGSTAAGTWLMLILTSGWRPEPNWIDRTGRALGACFILTQFIMMAW